MASFSAPKYSGHRQGQIICCNFVGICFYLCDFLIFFFLHHIGLLIWLQTVYDHDTFSKDDKMGDAEFEILPFIEALKINVTGLPSGTVIKRIQPSKDNCLADESCITYTNGKVVQDMILRLRHVECGEVEIQLQWIDLPGSRGLWVLLDVC